MTLKNKSTMGLSRFSETRTPLLADGTAPSSPFGSFLLVAIATRTPYGASAKHHFTTEILKALVCRSMLVNISMEIHRVTLLLSESELTGHYVVAPLCKCQHLKAMENACVPATPERSSGCNQNNRTTLAIYSDLVSYKSLQ